MVATLAAMIDEAPCEHVGVGFPGDMEDGCVLEPGNLSRIGGIDTAVDAEIDVQWRGFDLQARLREATGRDVRVVNDATLAALGATLGEGRELVFTLGTGFGIALVVDGDRVRVRDVGAEDFVDGETYDESLGEPARARDPRAWMANLRRAARGFVAEFDADIVHFGGGNARHLEPSDVADLASHVVINDAVVTLRGARRLFARDRA